MGNKLKITMNMGDNIPTISIVALHINSLKTSIKDRLSERILKNTMQTVLLQEIHFKI